LLEKLIPLLKPLEIFTVVFSGAPLSMVRPTIHSITENHLKDLEDVCGGEYERGEDADVRKTLTDSLSRRFQMNLGSPRNVASSVMTVLKSSFLGRGLKISTLNPRQILKTPFEKNF